jgi:hypothetical protein
MLAPRFFYLLILLFSLEEKLDQVFGKNTQCRSPLLRAISSFDSLSPRGLGSYTLDRIDKAKLSTIPYSFLDNQQAKIVLLMA